MREEQEREIEEEIKRKMKSSFFFSEFLVKIRKVWVSENASVTKYTSCKNDVKTSFKKSVNVCKPKRTFWH